MKPRLKPIALAVKQVLRQWQIDRMVEEEAKKREQEERERTEG